MVVDAPHGPPDLPQKVLDLAETHFARHAQRIAEYKRMMRLVNKKFRPFAQPPDPDRFKVVYPGTAGSLVHRIATQIVSDTPTVTYEPRNGSNEAQTDADLIEQLGQATLAGIAANSAIPPLEDAAKRALMGMYALEGPLFDFSAWGEPPTAKNTGGGRKALAAARRRYRLRQAENFAIQVRSLDPTTIVWDQHNPLNPRWYIQKTEMLVSDLTSDFPTWENRNKKADKDIVVVHKYWDPDWRLVLADSQPATYRVEDSGEIRTGPVPNVYGYVPIMLGFGVWGWADDDPEELCRSLLYWSEDEIIEEARVFSSKSWAVQLYGMPPLLAPDPEKLRDELAGGPGAIVQSSDPKNEPRPMQMPRPPEWLDQYEQNLVARTERNTVSSAMLGYREPGTTSGIQSGLHIGEARQQFGPIIKRLSRNGSTILNRTAHIIENVIQERVSVWLDRPGGRKLLSIDPDVFDGAYHYYVDLEPVDPTRDDRRGMLGLNYFAQGLLDPWTTLEDYLRLPNATKILKNIIKWRVMNSPRYIHLLEEISAQEAGFEEELKALEAAEALAGEGEPVAPEATGDFETIDMAGMGQTPMTPGPMGAAGGANGNGMRFPTRGQPLERQGRLGARVTEPLNDRASGARR